MNYAGFWRRFWANVLDSMILTIPNLLLAGTLTSFGTMAFGLGIGFGLFLGLLYKPVFESSALKATPGKALLGMTVVSETGDRLTFKQACLRFFCTYLSMLMAYIGYLMQPFTARRQTLHDMIAEAVVIREETPDNINYFTAWKDQFRAIMEKL